MQKEGKEDLKPIKSILKNPTSRKIKETLVSYGVKQAWAHNHFISAEEKKANNITLYVSMQGISSLTIEQLEEKIDLQFKKRKITLLDVDSLMPSIKEFVFKDVTSLF